MSKREIVVIDKRENWIRSILKDFSLVVMQIVLLVFLGTEYPLASVAAFIILIVIILMRPSKKITNTFTSKDAAIAFISKIIVEE